MIVGLGNPGRRYLKTRHNVGFAVLDALAGRLGADFTAEKYRGVIARARCGEHDLLLLKPQTYMNNSGQSVARAARYQVRDLSDLLVVSDDVHLPVGRLRLRRCGSAGGQKGLKSVIQYLGTEEFARLRLGVGAAADPGELTGHVLGKFGRDELPVVEEMISRAVDAVVRFVEVGVAAAMNEFN